MIAIWSNRAVTPSASELAAKALPDGLLVPMQVATRGIRDKSISNIYYCDIEGCRQNFVRPDLLARHKERHSTAPGTQRGESVDNDGFNLFAAGGTSNQEWAHLDTRTTDLASQSPVIQRDAQIATRDEPSADHVQATDPSRENVSQHFFASDMRTVRAVEMGGQSTIPAEAEGAPLLTPDSANVQTFGYSSTHHRQNDGPPWPIPPESGLANHLLQNLNRADAVAETPFGQQNGQDDSPVFYAAHQSQPRDNFATWLFDSPGTMADLDMANLPFLDFGLESTFSNAFNQASDAGSLHGRANSFDFRPFESVEALDVRISEHKRMLLLQLIRSAPLCFKAA
ncbi:hypothetical protein H2203_001128 [Taxawa tesnikishii (nom. ined.)]|nr:hypothetical protein H2203_001128 [Dothideales sp. JES 119]